MNNALLWIGSLAVVAGVTSVVGAYLIRAVLIRPDGVKHTVHAQQTTCNLAIRYDEFKRTVMLSNGNKIATFRTASLNRGFFEYMYNRRDLVVPLHDLNRDVFRGRQVNIPKTIASIGFKGELKAFFSVESDQVLLRTEARINN